jgi:starch phosphorylase
VQDPDRRDALEAELILDALQEEVIPMYYQRNAQGHSPEWVKRSKRAMSTVIPRFNMRRVLYDYTQGLYQPAATQYRRLAADGFAGAARLAEWKARVRAAWPRLSLRLLAAAPAELPRGAPLRLRVAATLGGLAPGDVRIELHARRMLPEADLSPPPLCSYGAGAREGLWVERLTPTGEHEPDGAAVFAVDARPQECGQFSTEVRVYPWHELLSHPYELGLMKWL